MISHVELVANKTLDITHTHTDAFLWHNQCCKARLSHLTTNTHSRTKSSSHTGSGVFCGRVRATFTSFSDSTQNACGANFAGILHNQNEVSFIIH